MEDYKRNLEKHIFNLWRSNKLLPYVIGGNSYIAEKFARKLFHHESVDSEVALNENNKVI